MASREVKTMRTAEQIQEAMAPLRAELWEVQRAEDREKGEALVGRCFKYHNSYSGPSERWWYYVKVTGVDSDGHMLAFAFQTDIHGKIEIEAPKNIFTPGTLAEGGGYLPIKAKEFNAAWRRLLRRVAAAKP